jgi:hypothetical protein
MLVFDLTWPFYAAYARHAVAQGGGLRGGLSVGAPMETLDEPGTSPTESVPEVLVRENWGRLFLLNLVPMRLLSVWLSRLPLEEDGLETSPMPASSPVYESVDQPSAIIPSDSLVFTLTVIDGVLHV